MWGLIAVSAVAGPWTTSLVWSGTDIAGNDGDVAVGVALAGWSPLGRLVLAIERQTPNGLSRTHHLDLMTIDCPAGWGACAAPVVEAVGVPQDDRLNLASLALEAGADPNGAPVVHLVRAVRQGACVEPTRALEEWTRDPVTGAWSVQQIHTPVHCGDAQLSHSVVAEDLIWSCWTVNPVGLGDDDNLWCGTRALGGNPGAWVVGGLANGVRAQDHGWFAVADGARYLLHRDMDPTPAVIRMAGPGVGGGMPPSNPLFAANFPSIARAPDGTLHAVWSESQRRIAYARCIVGGCADPASWEIQPRPLRFLTAGPVDHPEIAIASNGRRFVAWIEDHDPAVTDQRRVHVKSMCPSDILFPVGIDPGEVVDDIGVSPYDQQLLIGRPHLWIDDATDTVHMVFLEKDYPGPEPVHGDVYWAWRPVDPCP